MRLINGEFKDYFNCTIEIEDLFMKYMTEINYMVEVEDYYFPTVEDSYMKYNYMVDEVPINLEIIDTAGQDAFKGSRVLDTLRQDAFKVLRIGHYRQSDGFVFVYSVTDRLLVNPHCNINDCHRKEYFFRVSFAYVTDCYEELKSIWVYFSLLVSSKILICPGF